MQTLSYTAIASLDGYIADVNGTFDWAAPDEEVHAFVNELERPVGTYLLGRRMYEVLSYWDDPPELDEQPSHIREYAEIWRRMDKIVYSTTLESVTSARARIERDFDPDTIRRLKESAPAELSIGGAHVAGQAMQAGLVDELRLFLVPVLVGGGTRALPDGGARLGLELLDQRRFRKGTVYVRYRVTM